MWRREINRIRLCRGGDGWGELSYLEMFCIDSIRLYGAFLHSGKSINVDMAGYGEFPY